MTTPTLTPQAFVTKWRGDTRKERSVSQEHFIDLCRLVGHETPGENRDGSLVFEAGVGKQKGGQGWADVWKRGHFAWEYKGPKADLAKAYQQILQYRESLQNPPLLVVSDIQTIEVHTNFTNTVKQVVTLTLDDLLTPAGLGRLRDVFRNPEAFKSPQTTEQVTQQAAAEFAKLAKLLRDYGEEPQRIAHFLIRLLFCLFAEDVGLLPDRIFSQLVEATKSRAPMFVEELGKLFAAMSTGGFYLLKDIPHFNGKLFDDADVLPLGSDGVAILRRAAALDWSSIEPSILGTLFERSLDPAKRSQLGAHYTSRDDILLIVEPVLMAPLRRRWAEVRSQAQELAAKRDAATAPAQRTRLQGELQRLLRGFAQEIAETRVLDPACGAPRSAVRACPNGGLPLVGTAGDLPPAEADPAGGGPRATVRPKPGEHAARGGTPRRPQGRKPEPRYGYTRKRCQTRPEGQHPVTRGDGVSYRVGMSVACGVPEKPLLSAANRQWPGEEWVSGRWRRVRAHARGRTGAAYVSAEKHAA